MSRAAVDNYYWSKLNFERVLVSTCLYTTHCLLFFHPSSTSVFKIFMENSLGGQINMFLSPRSFH